jgi:hypothetical protein
MTKTGKALAWAGGLAVGVLGIVGIAKASKKPSATSQVNANVKQGTGIVLVPDVPGSPKMVTVPAGMVVNFDVPPNSSWISLTTPGGQSIPVSGSATAPLQINVEGPVTAVYRDANGIQQTATISFTLS